MITSRRSFFHGLLAAPAVVVIESLMPIRGIILTASNISFATMGPIKWRNLHFSGLQEVIDHITVHFGGRTAALAVTVPSWSRFWNARHRTQGVETIEVLAGVHHARCNNDQHWLTAIGGDVVKVRVRKTT